MIYSATLWMMAIIPSWSTLSNAQSPNIVFMIFDDVSFGDVSFNGGPIPTPFIDSLASDNSIKLNFHYTETTCSPSRSSLYTGRFAFKSGLNQNTNPRTARNFNPNLKLYPQLLDENEYNTFFAGKWHIGYKYSDSIPSTRGFQRGFFPLGPTSRSWFDRVSTRTFADFDIAYPLTQQRVQTQRAALFDPVTELSYHAYFSIDPAGNLQPAAIGSTTYIETLYTNEVINFLDDQTENDPFYVHYNLKTPHTPITEPPALDSNWIYDYTVCDVSGLTANSQQFCRMLLYAQERIDEIIQKVEAKGFYDNTIFVLTSDGANNQGQALPLRGSKGAFHEGSVRTMALLFGGYIADLLSNAPSTQCDYNGMIHISDWYNILTDFADITHFESDSDHSLEIWDDIKCSCGIYPNCVDGTFQKRTELISMRLCGNQETIATDSWPDKVFYSSYIIQYPWKLIVNASLGSSGSTMDCSPNPSTVDVWARSSSFSYLDGIRYFTPNQEFYDNYYEPKIDAGFGYLYESECLEALDGTADIDNPDYAPFAYSEMMLYNLETDKIEACNVAANYPAIVNNLWAELQAASSDYDAGPPEEPENVGAFWTDITSYDCNTGYLYTKPWDGDNEGRCGDATLTENDYGERDCRTIWRRLNQIKTSCLNGNPFGILEGDEESGTLNKLHVILGIGGFLMIIIVICVLLIFYFIKERKESKLQLQVAEVSERVRKSMTKEQEAAAANACSIEFVDGTSMDFDGNNNNNTKNPKKEVKV